MIRWQPVQLYYIIEILMLIVYPGIFQSLSCLRVHIVDQVSTNPPSPPLLLSSSPGFCPDPSPPEAPPPPNLSRDNRHRVARLRLVADPPGREEEQRDQPAPPALRVVVAPRVRARPTGPPPAVEAHELGALVDGHDAVDLAVRVRVVLAPELVALAAGRRHVHGRHGAVARGLGRRRHARPPVAGPVDRHAGDPALLEAEPDEPREGVVVRRPRAVVRVEVVLEGLAWGAGRSQGGRCMVSGTSPMFSPRLSDGWP